MMAPDVTKKKNVGPWDLRALQATPTIERKGTRRVQEFDRSILVSELYFEVAPFLGRPARAFGWLAMPEAPMGKLPAMLLIHGGGGTAIEQWAREWASRGFVALAINLYGQGPDRRRLPDGGCDWSDMDRAFEFTCGVGNSWVYQAVAAGIRAVAALRALPEVDPQQVGVTGVSWGGYLTNTIMCVDDHVALGIPVCGCGFDRRTGNHPDAPPEKRKRVFDLFDASNFSNRCTKPVLWAGGIWDPPPDQLMNCYQAVPDHRKTLSIRLVPHHNYPAYRRRRSPTRRRRCKMRNGPSESTGPFRISRPIPTPAWSGGPRRAPRRSWMS
jgi:cephalosporin-C deacetylase-like acetyl esterase